MIKLLFVTLFLTFIIFFTCSSLQQQVSIKEEEKQSLIHHHVETFDHLNQLRNRIEFQSANELMKETFSLIHFIFNGKRLNINNNENNNRIPFQHDLFGKSKNKIYLNIQNEKLKLLMKEELNQLFLSLSSNVKVSLENDLNVIDSSSDSNSDSDNNEKEIILSSKLSNEELLLLRSSNRNENEYLISISFDSKLMNQDLEGTMEEIITDADRADYQMQMWTWILVIGGIIFGSYMTAYIDYSGDQMLYAVEILENLK
jgi:hypothetical protein